MYRFMRIFLFLLLVCTWTVGSWTTPKLAKAQAEGQEEAQEVTLEDPQEEPAAGSFLGHIVQPGESIDDIAARYHTTVASLIEANQLSTPVQLIEGQLLRIRTWDAQPVAPGVITVDPAAPEAAPATEALPTEALPEEALTGEKWIDINLTEQTLTAFQGETEVRTFDISSGDADHLTVTGSFRIWAKIAMQDMSGGSRAAGNDYYVPDVPWVQYFFEDYSIHGAYWHNNFGYAISHGCVNLRVEDAKWLFEWADPHMNDEMVESRSWMIPDGDGTRVEVHY